MADKVDVTVLKQHVFHDGLSMVVLQPNRENPPIASELLAGLIAARVIAAPDGWSESGLPGATIASADGAVFSEQPAPAAPITTDLVRGTAQTVGDGTQTLIANNIVITDKSDGALASMGLAALIIVAIDEGVIPDSEEFRDKLVAEILARRAGDVDEDPEAPDEDEGEEGGEIPPATPPADDDAGDDVVDENQGLALTEQGGGWWHITGPGIETVKLRGEDAAKAMFDTMVAAAKAEAASEETPPA